MTTLEAVRTELTASAAVTALVSTRIYPLKAPQGAALPFVVLTVVSDVPLNSLDGSPATRMTRARLQADSYGKTYLSAHAVASAVDTVVAALSGVDLSASRDGTEDLYDDETELFRVSADYTVTR